MSDIGHAWLNMPFLNGRIMLRIASVEMQVCKDKQISQNRQGKVMERRHLLQFY